MKPFGILLLVFVLPAAASAQQPPGDAALDREIRQQSERYFDAIEQRDVKTLDALLLDKCLVYYPWGVSDTKAGLLKELSKPLPAAKPAAAGRPVQPAHTLSDVKLRLAGDTAILTAVLTAKLIDEPGVINTTRRTLVWARQHGRWRLMHDQWSLVGDPLFAEYWSNYFRGKDQNFKRDPNSLLVKAVAGRRPGRALDVGMGQGRNAIYLAKHGWQVTGIDPAEGALAVARQEANKRGLRITPVLQSAREFDWGHEQWDLIAVLYVPAVRGNVAKIRESLRPGGLVVIEAFLLAPGETGGGTEYQHGELRKMFADGFKLLYYEEGEGMADYGQKRMPLVHLIASRL